MNRTSEAGSSVISTSDKRAMRDAAGVLDAEADMIWQSNVGNDGKFYGSHDEMLDYRKRRRLAARLRKIAEAS